VVLDVKQENWAATAGYRARCGQAVWRFDPLDPQGRTARYNPLGHINRCNSVETLDELQKIATMLFPAPEHADPFWNEAARTGFIGVGAYVAETPD
ncbi:type IV secretory system conjugative DNA transfer family protein, partial [Brevundimonas diminuta]|uniref:type IV secretory system conjugative DNA transfer family protein n=1 Tax=Brevundimonas diminuta TaxID=293 RepID=UPI00168AAF00